MKTSLKRTLIKTAIYRTLSVTLTSLVGWFLTGSLQTGVGIGILYNAGIGGLYFVYERAWSHFKWGIEE